MQKIFKTYKKIFTEYGFDKVIKFDIINESNPNFIKGLVFAEVKKYDQGRQEEYKHYEIAMRIFVKEISEIFNIIKPVLFEDYNYTCYSILNCSVSQLIHNNDIYNWPNKVVSDRLGLRIYKADSPDVLGDRLDEIFTQNIIPFYNKYNSLKDIYDEYLLDFSNECMLNSNTQFRLIIMLILCRIYNPEIETEIHKYSQEYFIKWEFEDGIEMLKLYNLNKALIDPIIRSLILKYKI